MLPTCAVSCTVHDQSGNPEAGATITARLSSYEVYNGYVVPEVVTGTTNAQGVAVLNLWPNQLGAVESHYDVTIRPVSAKAFRTTATVPNESTAQLHLISELPVYPGKTDGQLILDEAVAAGAVAVAKAGEASISATAAQESASEASASAAEAYTSETNASGSASEAASSAAQAAEHASSAQDSASNASAHAATATTKAGEAAASAIQAGNSASAASGSASAASASESAASESASSASSSAASALNYSGIAATQASEAAAAALAAALSEIDAEQSASVATIKAAEASASELSAASSASTATTQAGIATTQAGIAETQAGIATTKATEASVSASEALASEQAAAASGVAADASALSAGASEVVATAQAGIATTKASEASASAASSATSAANASSSANAAAGAVVAQLQDIKSQTEYIRDQALAGLGAADNSQALAELLGAIAYVTDIALKVVDGVADNTGTFRSTDRAELFTLMFGEVLEKVGVVARAIAGGTVALQAGAAASPSLMCDTDTDTGLFWAAANALAIVTGGVERVRFTADGRTGFGTNAPSGLVDINDNKLRVRTAQTPASATAAGNAGDICWDANYVYVCTNTNTWRRAALSTW